MKKILRITVAIIAIAQLLCSLGMAESTVSPEQIADTQIRQALSNGASSATVAIMDGNGIVYAQAFGMRGKANSIPVDTRTQFTIGSTSKIFAAAAILLLCEDGKVQLDKPVIEYLPAFKMADPRYKDITVRMLLNHSSGIPGTNYKDSETSVKNRQYIEQTLALLRKCSLKSDPGDISIYSNDGPTLAEALVEKVSGMSYSNFLQEKIFNKSDMKNTSCYFKDGNENIAIQHKEGKAIPVSYVNPLGSAGIASTAIDLCHFAHAMWSGKLLNKKFLAEYCKEQYGPHTALTGKPYDKYGLGWDTVSKDEFASQGITVIAKDGDTNQFHSCIFTAPEEKLTVAIIACGPADVVEIALKIMQALLEEKGYVQAEVKKTSQQFKAVIPNDMLKFEGIYMNMKGGAAFKVTFDKATNMVRVLPFENGKFINPGPDSDIYLMSDGYFHNPPFTFKFVENDKGKYKAKCMVNYVNGSDGCSVLMQMLQPLQHPFPTKNFGNRSWLSSNLLYYDLSPAPFVISSEVDGLPGYIGINNDILRLTGETTATSALPYLRDTKEASLVEKNGKQYLNVLNYLYSDSKNTMSLQPQEKVVIGKEGYNEWRSADKDFILDCSVPAKSRILVISANGKILYDSLLEGFKPFELKKGDFVSFIGQPSSKFVLR